MTASGDFIPGDSGDFEAKPNYQTLFGIPLTPMVTGILVAVFGLACAVFLLVRLVQPALETNQALRQDVAEKEQQLLNADESRRQLEAARARLATTQQLRSDVLALFATEESMDTLLLDLNERVQAVNAGIDNEARRANLSRFERDPAASGIVNDGSLGPAVNNQLQRQVYNVEMAGSFAQTQSIIRNIERLQPLLVLRNFNSELDISTQAIRIDPQGRLVQDQAPPRIITSFQINALMPAAGETAAPAAGTPGAEGVDETGAEGTGQ